MSTGKDELAWRTRRVADVLVTDVRLPGEVDGWQVAERFREQDPERPVIYASGFSPVTPRPLSGSCIVQKPFYPAEIARTIRELREKKSAPLGESFHGPRRTARRQTRLAFPTDRVGRATERCGLPTSNNLIGSSCSTVTQGENRRDLDRVMAPLGQSCIESSWTTRQRLRQAL